MDEDHVRGDENSEQSSATSNEPESESKYDLYWQLCDAMEERDFDKFLEEALEENPTEEEFFLSVKGPSGNTLLHVAAGIKTCKCVLKHPLQVIHDNFGNQQLSWQWHAAQQNGRGDTALHVAARAGAMDKEAALLLENHDEYGIINKLNDLGNTALHEAVKNRHYEMTLLLLSRGSRPERPANNESKCPLYLAVEAEKEAEEAENDLVKKIRKCVFKKTNKLAILNLLVEAMGDISRIQGMSPVHGAVVHQSKDMLQVMLKRKELFDFKKVRYARDGTPLHLAAYVNYVDGVKFLVQNFASSAFEYDSNGYLPIHVACEMGCLETIRKLLRRWPHPEEMLTRKQGQNILHVAAKNGMATVVKYILEEPNHHEKLINAKDNKGNTPLHEATSEGRPEIVFLLTRRSRADLKIVNKDNSTALDIVDKQLKAIDAPLRKRLTRIILESAKAPRSRDLAICRPYVSRRGRVLKPLQMDRLKDAAETRMLVATLVAAAAFAAGFSVPGGYNGSEPDAGIATLLNKPMYDVFVICNTIAMYSSIVAVVILLWTQIQDIHAKQSALRNTRLPLLIALATMSMAFMAGVYVTISKRTWIAIVTLITGIAGLFVFLILYIALFVPLHCRPLQLLADYIIIAAISISGRGRRAGFSSRDPNDGLVQEMPVLPEAPDPNDGLVQEMPVLPEAPDPNDGLVQEMPVLPEAPAPYAPAVPPELDPYAPELVPSELVTYTYGSPSCVI